ncbi:MULTISPECIES: phosphotransferase enzyme family protein [unclassified Legionella]|uniref:phosphotransferase enzyme family protein n=1 Tax=unclassified Legionella TaxID=2622702 RepID=UPI00105578C6|nr:MULTISPECIES: aminoglycoside phosphotransferase family protein [unclassified Legionella]MDI9817763.1 aminoglycoside phosphotransferase family protein [Legionella sp. PL877]
MIVKNPSWQSLFPTLPEFVPFEGKELLPLQEILNIDGTSYLVKFDKKSTLAFMFASAKDNKRYFVKKIPDREREHYEESEQLTKWLNPVEFQVNASLYNYIDANDGSIFYVYPYVDGTRLLPNPEQLILLGTALAKLHKMIKDYPEKPTVIHRTHKRINQLEYLQKEIALGKHPVGPIPDYVKQFALKHHFNLINSDNSQILHGDLNPGNLLITEDKTICFFDFEDALHSYSPVLFDLTFIIERIIFNHTDSKSDALILSNIFMKAYRESGGIYEYQQSDEYSLSILALKAFCLLTFSEISGNLTLNSEWHKFFKLSRQADRNINLLKTILQGSL